MKFVTIFIVRAASVPASVLNTLREALAEDPFGDYVNLDEVRGGYAITATYGSPSAGFMDLRLETLLNRTFGDTGYEQITAE